MKLTENFKLSEFEKSEIAEREGIDNSIPFELRGHAFRLAEWLQILRARLEAFYGRQIPLVVSSGYRSRALNDHEDVQGSDTSAHCFCLAADIKAIGLSATELWQFIRDHMKDIGYDQNIEEHGAWVHVGLSNERKRMEDLIARREKGKTVYRHAE